MNRIKLFRVWNKLEKKMIYSEVYNHICLYSDGSGIIYDKAGKKLINFLPAELMEYTFKNDINNYKIFEGDIVESCNGVIRIVEYNDYDFWIIKTYSGDICKLTPMNSKSIKIIGNIYQIKCE